MNLFNIKFCTVSCQVLRLYTICIQVVYRLQIRKKHYVLFIYFPLLYHILIYFNIYTSRQSTFISYLSDRDLNLTGCLNYLRSLAITGGQRGQLVVAVSVCSLPWTVMSQLDIYLHHLSSVFCLEFSSLPNILV